MKAAALLGELTVSHRLPAGARMLCSPGQELTAGAPIAEVHAPRKVRAVPLKYLDGAAVGDPVPAGTTVGAEGGWRGRRRTLEWDARVVALNPAGGRAFLRGPEIRTEIRARVGGLVGPIEAGLPVEITGPGLALYCPTARGPDAFGSLALHGGDGDEPEAAYPEATVLAVKSGIDPDGLASPWPENLAGLLLPGLPESWRGAESGIPAPENGAGPAPISYGVVEGVGARGLAESLWSALAALAGCPVSLTVDPDTGTGELVVSGSVGDAAIDRGEVRGFGPDGVVSGRLEGAADGPSVRVAGGRLLEGVRVLVGEDALALAAVNVERVVAEPE